MSAVFSLDTIERYSIEHDLDGPRIRLGFVWFVAVFASMLLGTVAVAVLFGLVAGAAGLQTAAAWRSHRVRVNQALAGVGPVAVTLGAALSARLGGVLLIMFALAAVAFGPDFSIDPALLEPARRQRQLAVAAATLRAGLFPAIAATAVVLVHDVDTMAMAMLVALVCVYDCGDYLCGAGYQSRVVGPLSGIAGIVVVTLTMTQINPVPAESDVAVFAIGVLAAVLCPAGQLFASWLLPEPRSASPALRRLDSWLLVAPMFLVLAWLLG